MAAGTPRELFRVRGGQGCFLARCCDISADGQRFLFHDPTTGVRESVTRMDLVLNWAATLAKGR